MVRETIIAIAQGTTMGSDTQINKKSNRQYGLIRNRFGKTNGGAVVPRYSRTLTMRSTQLCVRCEFKKRISGRLARINPSQNMKY